MATKNEVSPIPGASEDGAAPIPSPSEDVFSRWPKETLIYPDRESQAPWAASPIAAPLSEHQAPYLISPTEALDNILEGRDLPIETKWLICGSARSADTRRGNENHVSYIFKNNRTPILSESHQEVHEAALRGRVTPLGALVVGHALGMRSIELAKLTGRGESWGGMRSDVKQAILEIDSSAVWAENNLDKKKSDNNKPAFRIGWSVGKNQIDPTTGMPRLVVVDAKKGQVSESMPHDKEIQAFVGRARKYRTTLNLDGKEFIVKEQLHFIIRMDEESGFDQEIAERIRYYHEPGESVAYTLTRDPVLKDFARNLQEQVKSDELKIPKHVVPITLTTYAYDKNWTPEWPIVNRRPVPEEVQQVFDAHKADLEAAKENPPALPNGIHNGSFVPGIKIDTAHTPSEMDHEIGSLLNGEVQDIEVLRGALDTLARANSVPRS